MSTKKSTTSACLILVSTAALMMTACSSEPSSSDMKAALEPELKQMLEIQANMANAFTGRAKAASATGPKLEDIRKIGCKEDGEKAYRCDVEIVTAEGGAKKSSVVPARFVKTSSGWQAAR